ncbi:FixH family protein [Methylorubrum rhodesianum]|uniref:FixH family protein n=1 Tax=Methylorubrum rhodesianum TaxID=29427 RepID=A0ABU9Z5I0_9HYPH|nr:FixH family protein [Methylorubrum rhodesianum]
MPADLKDYAFEILEPRTKSGEALLQVRLVRKTTATTVPDAVVFARRLDMAPDGMETMKTRLEPQPSPDPGIYAFKANLAMEGRWRLSLAAKVPGETGTVRDQLVFEAVE